LVKVVGMNLWSLRPLRPFIFGYKLRKEDYSPNFGQT